VILGTLATANAVFVPTANAVFVPSAVVADTSNAAMPRSALATTTGERVVHGYDSAALDVAQHRAFATFPDNVIEFDPVRNHEAIGQRG
jgi:hypothetical protein